MRNLLVVQVVFVCGLLICGNLKAEETKASPSKPNIIFILSDDVGLGDVHCSGGPFKTPQIDKLAEGGTRFAQCYAMPLCGPSRATALTGRYLFRTGMLTNQDGNRMSPSREIMLPRVMKTAGYVTAQVGKWSQMPLKPGDWGFDEYLCFLRSGRYWREQTASYTLNGHETNLPAGTYLPDLMHEFLADFMKRHKDQPFYVHYAMSHIHGPIVRTPDSKAGSDHYADNITYMDKLVGQLVAELDKLGLREKTLLVFVGDNGTAVFGVKASTVNGRHVFGNKGTMKEGGSRVPMVVSWPGTVPAGKVLPDLVDFSDFLPTFAELGGAKLPEGVKIDGHSFAPQLRGEKGTPRDWVFVQLGAKWYVRDQGFKLTQGGELFDMAEAPFVEKPVTNEAARAKLQAVLKELKPGAGKTATGEEKPGKKRKKKL